MCVLIGDSITDIHAAHAAGVPAIGYANKASKPARFTDIVVVITRMIDLATALRSASVSLVHLLPNLALWDLRRRLRRRWRGWLRCVLACPARPSRSLRAAWRPCSHGPARRALVVTTRRPTPPQRRRWPIGPQDRRTSLRPGIVHVAPARMLHRPSRTGNQGRITGQPGRADGYVVNAPYSSGPCKPCLARSVSTRSAPGDPRRR